jgi:hypothetical protein
MRLLTAASKTSGKQTGPVAYALGAGLAWVNDRAAFTCYAAIALYFVFPHSVRAHR